MFIIHGVQVDLIGATRNLRQFSFGRPEEVEIMLEGSPKRQLSFKNKAANRMALLSHTEREREREESSKYIRANKSAKDAVIGLRRSFDRARRLESGFRWHILRESDQFERYIYQQPPTTRSRPSI